MHIGKRDFQIGNATYTMGILNVTPDSFSDGGKYSTTQLAVQHGLEMATLGADILDIGGESTRPGYTRISVKEEIERVVPVILALKEKLPDMPLSIDTYKSAVCREAIAAGADMINDIWGFREDEDMASLAAETGLPCCLMHNRKNTDYNNFFPEFLDGLLDSLTIAFDKGVQLHQILLDPGIGFGKTYEQNLMLLNRLEIIKERFPQFPLVLGTSRKSTIGKALGGVAVDKRVIGTVATTVIGITKGCDFIRVHDINENKEACLMADAILRKH